nr:class I SAM-dependent methyltransferase [Aestuariivivens insulae]
METWHRTKDPWGYNSNEHDLFRREMLFSELPEREYKNVLDIGCGQGFITKQLNVSSVTGIDISQEAIRHANKNNETNVIFLQGSIFDITKMFKVKFDLVLITGVLYQQYIGDSSNLIYLLIDQILEERGHLVTVHINEWNICQFPFLKLKEVIYPYRDYNHKLEVYVK